MRLRGRPRLDGYLKFNALLLDRKELCNQLEKLIQWELVGVVTGNKWRGNLKALIRSLTVKYAHIALDRAVAEAALGEALFQINI